MKINACVSSYFVFKSVMLFILFMLFIATNHFAVVFFKRKRKIFRLEVFSLAYFDH